MNERAAQRTSQADLRPTPVAAFCLAQLSRMRFQLVGGFIAAVILPAMVRARLEGTPGWLSAYDISMVGTLWAFLFGFLIFRKVTAYPGVQATAYILPTFLGAYALTVVGFFALRLVYSRYQFAASFAFTTIFFYAIFFVVRRARRMQFVLVGLGDVARVRDIKLVDWRMATTPAQAAGSTPLVVDLKADLSPEWERFIADCALAGRPIYNAKQVAESLSGRVQIEHLSENTFGSLLPNSIYDGAKRYFDFVLAMIAVVILSPVLVVVALAIRLDSPGPSLFLQQRMGFRGRIFTVFKFRSMRQPSATSLAPVADAGPQSEMTLADDARITKLGKFLRKTRIDELPQIINILRGEMSWIGPRPEALSLSRWYEEQIPFYRYRHIVRPGITGWAQVTQGHVTSLEDADLKLQYDFFYVKNFSFWLDVLVMLRTLRVVFTGYGAK